MAGPKLTRPTFEHHPNGFGVNHSSPRISWRFAAPEDFVPNWVQTGYEIEIISPVTGKATTYKVEDESSVLVPWPDSPLKSRDCATVRVRSFGKSKGSDAQSKPTEWSDAATVEAGLLDASDWSANFIASTIRTESNRTLQPVRFWKTFHLPPGNRGLLQGRIYIAAFGVFDLYINGRLASDECLAPGWTSYSHRLNYRILDVGTLLNPDAENTICVEVGEGWYAGRLGFKGGKRFCYGDRLAALVQLEAKLGGADLWTLTSDDSWSSSPSPIQSSGLYAGEVYDDRQESSDLRRQPQSVSGVEKLPWPKARLVASDSPPVRVIERRSPQEIFHSKNGKTIIDFGQNLVGKLLIKSLDIPEGSRVSFKHAEVLEHGELGTRPLRTAECIDTVIGAGRKIEDWMPKFTFHGFRYVQVEGWPTDLTPSKNDLVALVMHSDLRRRGYFQCSNSHVNRLHENVVWSTKGNFVSIPTDCPQRDERLGWTGDLQVFCSAASFLYDTLGFLGSWLEDVADEQLEEDKGGIPPLVVPNVIPPNWRHKPQAVWDDVTILAPRDLYLASADRALLERQFNSMQTWLDQGVERGPDGLWSFDLWQLSDWLDPSAPPDDPGNGRTDGVLVADAYLVHVTQEFARLCDILGKRDLAAKYRKDFEKLKPCFQRKYISPAGNLMSNTQTGIALAVQFGLYGNNDQLQVASANLGKLVRLARFHISTGFAGTPVITHALTTTGQHQLAYRMLLEKTCPSWLYPVTMGATTIWERWDSMLPNGDINPGQMTSFNHYALGAVASWLHSTVGGISPLEPGWRVIKVRPVPGGNLTSADVSFDGPYGLISCSWTWRSEKFELSLEVPPNSSAVVTLPSEWQSAVACGSAEKCRVVGAGVHKFSETFKAAEWPPSPIVAINQTPAEPDIAT